MKKNPIKCPRSKAFLTYLKAHHVALVNLVLSLLILRKLDILDHAMGKLVFVAFKMTADAYLKLNDFSLQIEVILRDLVNLFNQGGS